MIGRHAPGAVALSALTTVMSNKTLQVPSLAARARFENLKALL
jgi:hypothetical protein